MLSRQKLYLFWLLGFGIAAIGASWDASFHFKYIRDLTQLPHITDAIGNIIIFFVLFLFWEKTKEKNALKIVVLGIIIFLVDIPLDELWHRTFGLDLTAWSPTHLGLYYGTTVALFGVIKLLRQEPTEVISPKMKKICLFIFFALLFNSIWFPMIQQEQGVVALYQLKNGISIAGEEILRYSAVAPKEVVYKWTPDWLYLTYAIFAITFLFGFMKLLKVSRFSATFTASIFVLFRAVMDLIYLNTGYQQSAIPYFLIPVALIFDLVWNLKKYRVWEKIICLVMIDTVLIYLLTFLKTEIPIIPPIVPISLLLAIPAGILGYFLAQWVYKKLFS